MNEKRCGSRRVARKLEWVLRVTGVRLRRIARATRREVRNCGSMDSTTGRAEGRSPFASLLIPFAKGGSRGIGRTRGHLLDRPTGGG